MCADPGGESRLTGLPGVNRLTTVKFVWPVASKIQKYLAFRPRLDQLAFCPPEAPFLQFRRVQLDFIFVKKCKSVKTGLQRGFLCM